MANKKIIPVVDALKELYGKLGGTPADVEDISTTTEIIQEIADVASPGGGGGGGNALIVSMTETGIDKSYSNLLEAYTSHTPVYLYFVVNGLYQVSPLEMLQAVPNGYIAVFHQITNEIVLLPFFSNDIDANMDLFEENPDAPPGD